MRLVADESCDFSVAVAVRAAGHDVVSIMEAMPGVNDDQVIAVATGDKRLLLTEDKDFGQLVFAAAKENSGVILIRYPTSARAALPAAVIKLGPIAAKRCTAISWSWSRAARGSPNSSCKAQAARQWRDKRKCEARSLVKR